MPRTKPIDFDNYLEGFPKDIQVLLLQLRATIRKAAPEAEEIISYGMPAFRYKGMLVWYAAHTHHIGFYPRVSGISAFKQELSAYKESKGAVQFPYGRPLPVRLISRIVKFRLKENSEKAKK